MRRALLLVKELSLDPVGVPDASQRPLNKVREELEEVEEELSAGQDGHEALAEEIGDLLFAVVNLARKANVQPGPALDRTNAKFRRRFAEIERMAGEKGIDMHTAGLEVLDGLWDEVKRGEG